TAARSTSRPRRPSCSGTDCGSRPPMDGGTRTPEELETLLEDAFLPQSPRALTRLFQPGATLVVSGGLAEARGHRQIARVAAQLWDSQRLYLADPRRALQVRDTPRVASG